MATLSKLNHALLPKVFFISHYITLADVGLYVALHPLLSTMEDDTKLSLPALSRWFDFTQHYPGVQGVTSLPLVSFRLNDPLTKTPSAKATHAEHKGEQQEKGGEDSAQEKQEKQRPKKGAEKKKQQREKKAASTQAKGSQPEKGKKGQQEKEQKKAGTRYSDAFDSSLISTLVQTSLVWIFVSASSGTFTSIQRLTDYT